MDSFEERVISSIKTACTNIPELSSINNSSIYRHSDGVSVFWFPAYGVDRNKAAAKLRDSKYLYHAELCSATSNVVFIEQVEFKFRIRQPFKLKK